jgi:serine/threonine-protein kinase
MIGDYRIVGFLGAGGMGSVYHGVHTKIDRPAAIKVLSNPADGSTFKERFFNEARVQSSLQHPNIATLYDFQVSASGDDLFIVMEFVDGETLDAFIGRRHFAVEDALVTFRSICEAAKFMHENNVVHRDIKPQNIKISSKGVVKMLDFGIAKDAVSDGLTRVGGIVGTPNYLAPEQLIEPPASNCVKLGSPSSIGRPITS